MTSTSRHAIAQGDVLEVLRTLPDATFDAVLTDPPYGLSFMGKQWDYDVPSVDVWREVLRVLKPGGALLSFGGTRTWHRIAVGIEDAGFEIRDSIAWMYGSGFPKSCNVSKQLDRAAGAPRPVVGSRVLTGSAALSTEEKGGTFASGTSSAGRTKVVEVTGPATELAQTWDGYGTALKPAFEPILLCRKPLEGTIAANVAKWGCGALAIDACRIGTEGGTRKADTAAAGATKTITAYGNGLNGGGCEAIDAGRWPANVILDETAAAALDEQSGTTKSGTDDGRRGRGGLFSAGDGVPCGPQYGDSGGASRFFYCAKVSKSERERGCHALPLRSAAEADREEGSDGLSSPRAGAGRTSGSRNHHPTLKPLALTEYLARLVLPPNPGQLSFGSPLPGATLLVPYSGAGSEIIGALRAGWPLVFGIEAEADYVEIAHARIAAAMAGAK